MKLEIYETRNLKTRYIRDNGEMKKIKILANEEKIAFGGSLSENRIRRSVGVRTRLANLIKRRFFNNENSIVFSD